MSERARVYSLLGNYQESVEIAQPLFSEEECCEEEPHRARANALIPLLILGKDEEAIECHRLGYQQIYQNQNFLSRCGDHILFLTMTGNYSSAAKVFNRHYRWIHQVNDPYAVYYFLRCSKYFLEMSGSDRLNANEVDNINRAVSKTGTLPKEKATIQLALDIVMDHVLPLAQQYDQRNGTTHLTDSLEFDENYKQWERNVPIDPKFVEM